MDTTYIELGSVGECKWVVLRNQNLQMATVAKKQSSRKWKGTPLNTKFYDDDDLFGYENDYYSNNIDAGHQQNAFSPLSPELIDAVFAFLSPKTLFSVAQTSRQFFIYALRYLYRRPNLRRKSDFSSFISCMGSPRLYNEHVRALDLSLFPGFSAFVSDLTLKLIAQSCGSRLRELNLNGCGRITEDGLKDLVESCPNLEILILDGCDVSDYGLELISKNLNYLVKISLLSCTNITDRGLWLLAPKARYLESIDISFAKKVTGNGIISIAQIAKGLKHVYLKACGQFSDQHLQYLNTLCPQLETLGLEYNSCSHLLTREVVMYTLRQFHSLQEFRLVMPLLFGGDGCVRQQLLSEFDIANLKRECKILQVPYEVC